MTCKNCGQPLPYDGAACGRCGAGTEPSGMDIFLPYDLDAAEPLSPAPVEEAPAPVIEPAAPPAAPQPDRRRRPLPPHLLTGLLAVLAGAILLIAVLGQKQTVYLLTEQISSSSYILRTISYQYDEAGRITEYRNDVSYDGFFDSVPDTGVTADDSDELSLTSSLCFSYIYGQDGNISSVVMVNDSLVSKIEYVYEDGQIAGLKTYGLTDSRYEPAVECNSQGLLTCVSFLYDDEVIYAWEFEYYDSGRIRQTTAGGTASSYKTVTAYDEAGNTIKQEIQLGEVILSNKSQEFDHRGNMTSYSDSSYSWTVDYTYKGRRLDSMVWTVTASTGEEASATFDCQYDGSDGILTVVETSGDADVLSMAGYGSDPTIKFQVDKAGNLLCYEVFSDDTLLSSVTNTYREIRVSRDYQKPNVTGDPQYLYLFYYYLTIA